MRLPLRADRDGRQQIDHAAGPLLVHLQHRTQNRDLDAFIACKLAKRPQILRKATPTESNAGSEIRHGTRKLGLAIAAWGSPTLVEMNAAHDRLLIQTRNSLAHAGDFVGKGDQGRLQRVRGVFDHFGVTRCRLQKRTIEFCVHVGQY